MKALLILDKGYIEPTFIEFVKSKMKNFSFLDYNNILNNDERNAVLSCDIIVFISNSKNFSLPIIPIFLPKEIKITDSNILFTPYFINGKLVLRNYDLKNKTFKFIDTHYSNDNDSEVYNLLLRTNQLSNNLEKLELLEKSELKELQLNNYFILLC